MVFHTVLPPWLRIEADPYGHSRDPACPQGFKGVRSNLASTYADAYQKILGFQAKFFKDFQWSIKIKILCKRLSTPSAVRARNVRSYDLPLSCRGAVPCSTKVAGSKVSQRGILAETSKVTWTGKLSGVRCNAGRE